MDSHKDKTLDGISALFQRAELSGLCQQAITFYQQGRSEEALTILDRVININPNMAEAHHNRGLVLRGLGRVEAALEALERAIEHFPNYAEAHKNRGVVLTDLGRFDEARISYRRAIDMRPDYSEAYRDMMLMQNNNPDDDIVSTMEGLYKNADTTSHSRMHLGFGLGKAYSDLKCYEQADYYYMEANRLKREEFHYDVNEDIEKAEYLCNLFTPEYFMRYTDTGIADNTPIFIVGMPRSGTTLLEQILASHPEIEGAGEILFISQLACQQGVCSGQNSFSWLKEPAAEILKNKGNEYLRQLRICGGMDVRYITNKSINNFFLVGFIRLILPKARIIHVRRNAQDTCLSIFTNYFSDSIPYSYDLTELGRYYCLYISLMNHWNKVLPGYIYEISYESLVDNLEVEVKKLLDYCELPFDENCLKYYENKRAVTNASFSQVRKPLYKTSVGRWKNHEKMLLPLGLGVGD